MSEPRSISSRRCAVHAAYVVLFLIFALALPNGAQQEPNKYYRPMPEPAGSPAIDTPGQPGDPDSIEQERRLRLLNADRQKSMVSDTNKLLKLASELNAEVSSSNRDSLTQEQLRKVGEIEKLAHRVKEKMSTSIGNTPVYQAPPLPPMR